MAIGSKLVANLLTAAGVDRVITMDLHADQIQGFFEMPVDHLIRVVHISFPYVQELRPAQLDHGGSGYWSGTKRANAYAKYLNVDMAICYKQRKVANEVANMTVIGDVKG